jgi:replicative DNA helicase
MAEKLSLRSEGAELDGVLDELQREHEVREMSGWDSGFANLNRALDGILPGLYLLIGPPGVGKTCFAKQLLDQVAERNRAPTIFFSFAESKKELRIRTLARLSGLDNREIRRGSAYLLHWYGVPRLGGNEAEQLPPTWEKLKRMVEEARSWLDAIYLVECQRSWSVAQIESQVGEIIAITGSKPGIVVIDDCQRLGDLNQSMDARMPIVVEQVQQAAMNLKAPLIATWPDLDATSGVLPHRWNERIPGADVVLTMEKDLERSQKLTEPNQAIILHIVKNRGGEKGKLAFDFFPSFSRFKEP